MKAGMWENNTTSETRPNDVFDNLANKLRHNASVRQMLDQIIDGKVDKVLVGIGREYEE